MKLFPKQKKVTICGFEFLQTSVIIFALVLLSFLSLTLNIKQMDDYRTLKTKHSLQVEYIQKMQEVEKEGNNKSK
jgi:biopolymer transport protein ExbB/TolQ